MNDEEFEAAMHYEKWCKKNEHKVGGSIMLQEAFEAFEDDVFDLCVGKIANKEGAHHYRGVLNKFKRWKGGDTLDIARAKQYPIDQLVAQLGYEPHYNRNIKCLLHDDKTPSFRIYRKGNSYYCHGCAKGGDVIDLLMKAKGLSFTEAVNWLT